MASNREQPAMKPADSTMEPRSTPMNRVVPPAGQHRLVHELHERANACSDRRDEDHELALDAQLVLNGAVNEHDDQGGQGVDGVDLALVPRELMPRPWVGSVSQREEEDPPDAPGIRRT